MPCSEIIPSESYADFIIRYYSFASLPFTREELDCVDFVSNQYAISHVPLASIPPLSMEHYQYSTIPKLYALLDTTSMEASGIIQTSNQPALGYKGRGTIIGFVDTGINYQDPLFLNSDGTTRILGIWDQTITGNGINSSNPIEDLHFGTEFTREQINEALMSADPLSVVPTKDNDGHGTFLAKIAAGNEAPELNYTGAAPECSIVVVKLKQAKQYLRDYYFVSSDVDAYQENDIMLGIKYLLYMSSQSLLPLTILLGLGTNLGSHDGTSSLATFMSYISTSPGIITVVAGGNETGYGHHHLGVIASGNEYEDVELHVAQGEFGFTLELWSRAPELYSVGFISPTGEQIERVPNTTGDGHRLTFLLEKTVIYFNYRVSESGTGSQLILMRFQEPTPGIWRIRVHNSLFIRGEYHMWLPVRGFISNDTFFLKPNPNTTITEPGNAPLLITIAGYNHNDNSLYIHSSRGYSRQDVIKPDLAAPGVNVSVPAGRGSQTLSGTSVAAAHAAGAAANLLSWAFTGQNDLYMNTSAAKSFLVRGARRNPIFSYPNREWGYGTLDLYNSFIQLRG